MRFSVLSKTPVFRDVMLARVLRWTSKGNSENDTGDRDFVFTNDDEVDQANISTSLCKKSVDRPVRMHKVVLDIDHEAELVPSTTPGHYHLYIDVEVYEDEYFDMIEFMGRAGVLQKGYVSASKARGFTAVRLPWVQKDGDEVVTAGGTGGY